MNDNTINIDFWKKNGFVVCPNILTPSEAHYLSLQARRFIDGDLMNNDLRSDLSGEADEVGKEKITQIMRPSLINKSILDSTAYVSLHQSAKTLLGEDVDLDFDMIINKQPHTQKETPWHQDAAYWPQLEDNRACSFWIALENVNRQNGCMMYISGTHTQPLRPHSFSHSGGALQTLVTDDEHIYYGEINKGTAIAHHGHSVHGALGNHSDRSRRAWIVNYRPTKMIEHMRSQGYDHTGDRKNKSK